MHHFLTHHFLNELFSTAKTRRSNDVHSTQSLSLRASKAKHLILFLIGFFLFSFGAKAQEISAKFGKNRVQYSDDFDSWSSYETENFVTYWYGKARNVAISSIQLAEYDFDEIQNVLEHRINEKIELVVYSDLGDLYQTNIGLQGTDPNNVESVQLFGTKLFVHFDGNHQHLREGIREGVARVFIYSMLYGSSFQDYVQNTFMSDMPEWYKAGIIHYIKDSWTNDDDAEFRYLIQDKKRPFRNFRTISRREPKITGKAFWNYLVETYGVSSISNIIYLTRINRSIKSAFRYVLGESYEKVTKDCLAYYKDRYAEETVMNAPDTKKKFAINSNEAEYQNLKLSPDKKWLAYSINKNGRVKMVVENLESGKKIKLKTIGYNNPYRETAVNYPVYFWSQDSKSIGYFYEKKGIIQIVIRNLETKEIYKNTLNPIFDNVYSASFIDDKNLLICGNTEGFSDLYIYNLNKRIPKNMTKDYHDDLDAVFTSIHGKKGVLFSSNRTNLSLEQENIDTSLAISNFDLFFIPWDDQSKVYQLTNTEYADEFDAEITGSTISYITDRYGVKSIVSQKITQNFKLEKEFKSIQLRSGITDKSCTSEECYYVTSYNKRELLIHDTISSVSPSFSSFQELKLQELVKGPILEEEALVNDVNDTENIPSGWFFDTEFEDPPKNKEGQLLQEKANVVNNLYSTDNVHRFTPIRVTAARLRFKINSMGATLDNEPLFGGLNSYAGDKQGYIAPPMGLLMKIKLSDAFEDYIYEGGIRFATNFSGYEAFMTYEDRKHQWDHFYGSYYRSRSDRRIDQFDLLEKNQDNTYLGYYQAKYPFDEFQSIRLSGTLRSDRKYTLITNKETFGAPVRNSQRIGIRAEYVYDNSSQRSINIYNGIRAKFFIEGMNRFRIQFADRFVIDPSEGFMTILGLDSRYYLPIFEKSIFAARISAGTSLGGERTLFYVGGVERSLLPGFDNSTGIPERNFAFENIAPQLRGFDRNIRNGTSYVVSTLELRVPVFRHIFSDQLKYDFLREFQVVGFLDGGTAWHGLSPYSPENPINSATFQSGESVEINVQYFRDPIVFSYGYGFRTTLFGYFVKLDFGYGVETRAVLPRKVHISMGTDF